MDLSQLSTFEKDQLIQFFAYHMESSLRHKLMAALPYVYNHLIGYEVVSVISRVTGDRIEPT